MELCGDITMWQQQKGIQSFGKYSRMDELSNKMAMTIKSANKAPTFDIITFMRL